LRVAPGIGLDVDDDQAARLRGALEELAQVGVVGGHGGRVAQVAQVCGGLIALATRGQGLVEVAVGDTG